MVVKTWEQEGSQMKEHASWLYGFVVCGGATAGKAEPISSFSQNVRTDFGSV